LTVSFYVFFEFIEGLSGERVNYYAYLLRKKIVKSEKGKKNLKKNGCFPTLREKNNCETSKVRRNYWKGYCFVVFHFC